MLPEERKLKILEMLKYRKSLTVKRLCDELEASEATIRRDLTALENEGKLKRTHGGAVLSSSVPIEYEENLYQKENRYLKEKKAIAEKAFELIKQGDSIAIDAGTTTFELAKLIGRSQLNITVITNSATIANALSDNGNLILYLIGGKVRTNTLAAVGSIAVETMKRFNVKKSFLGVNGITLDNGLTTQDMDEAEIKRTMLSISKDRYVLADHSKFDKIAISQISPISMIDFIITDKKVDEKTVEIYGEYDIEVITV